MVRVYPVRGIQGMSVSLLTGLGLKNLAGPTGLLQVKPPSCDMKDDSKGEFNLGVVKKAGPPSLRD